MKITRTINGQEITIELTAEEMREAYYEIDEEYLREDIQQWAEDNDENISEKLERQNGVLSRKKDDANASRWDNIENAYYACRK